jgi:hypothetical protein
VLGERVERGRKSRCFGSKISSAHRGQHVVEVRSLFCEERIQLVANYAAAVAEYYATVRELEFGMITASEDIYSDLRHATESARSRCENARKELDEHEFRHQCATRTSAGSYADPSARGGRGQRGSRERPAR